MTRYFQTQSLYAVQQLKANAYTQNGHTRRAYKEIEMKEQEKKCNVYKWRN